MSCVEIAGSLQRGDLAHMLSFDSTTSFFQVKSILIRLRRELQNIEFLTPIEFEHSILISDDGLKSSVFNALEIDGYTPHKKSIALRQSV